MFKVFPSGQPRIDICSFSDLLTSDGAQHEVLVFLACSLLFAARSMSCGASGGVQRLFTLAKSQLSFRRSRVQAANA
jgi:hypothetical protein